MKYFELPKPRLGVSESGTRVDGWGEDFFEGSIREPTHIAKVEGGEGRTGTRLEGSERDPRYSLEREFLQLWEAEDDPSELRLCDRRPVENKVSGLTSNNARHQFCRDSPVER